MIKRTILVPVVLSLFMSVALASQDSLLIRADSIIGNNIGHFIDKQDKSQILQSLKSENFTTPSSWKSASSGIRYTVNPGRPHESQKNACRDFTLNFAFGTFLKEFSGTACQESNGNWVVIK